VGEQAEERDSLVSAEVRDGEGGDIHQVRILVSRIKAASDPYRAEPRQDALHVGLGGRHA